MPTPLKKTKFDRTIYDRLFVLTQEITPSLLDQYVKNASPNASGELGYLYEIYFKVRQYDARIGSAIDKRVDNLTHIDWQVRSNGDSQQAQEAATLVNHCLDKITFSQFLEDLFDGKLMGASILELTWREWNGYMIPKHPRQIPYSRLAQGATAQRGDYGRLYVTDGFPMRTNRTSVEELLEDNPNKFIYAYGREKDAYYDVTGLMKPLLSLYIVKYYALLFWMQYAEKYGEPFVIGKLPDRLFKEYQSQMKSILKNAGRDRYAVILEEMQIESQTIQGNPDTYKNLIDYVDESCVIKILGNNLTSKVEGGSFAAAGVHQSGEMRKLVADSSWAQEIINEQLVKYIINVNFPTLNEDEFPVFEFMLPQNVDEFNEIRKLGEASKYVPVPKSEFYLKGGIRMPKTNDNGETDEEVVESGSSLSNFLNP